MASKINEKPHWAVVSRSGRMCFTGDGACVFGNRDEACRAHAEHTVELRDGNGGGLYAYHSWNQMYEDGYRCVKVDVAKQEEA